MRLPKAARLRDQIAPDIPIIGNGDVKSVHEAREKCSQHQLDGAMIGRGIFDNPWLFMEEQRERTQAEKLEMLWTHTQLFDRVWQGSKNFHILRRYYSIYCEKDSKPNPFVAELRAKLVQSESTFPTSRKL